MTTKAEIALLEKAFSAEIEGAMNKCPRLMQTKSKLAVKMVDEGLLTRVTENFGRPPFVVRLEGYELTHAGRLLYCLSCPDDEPI